MRLSKDAADGIPWDAALRDKGAEKSRQLFKDVFLRAQELSIPMCNNLGKEGLRLAWLRKDLLVKIKYKKKMHRQWNWGCVPWEEYKGHCPDVWG